MIQIEHIDEIGRRLQRDVLFVEFHPRDLEGQRLYQYEDDQRRVDIIQWLDQHSIPWQMCGPLASKAILTERYRGAIFLDIAIDINDPTYCQLLDFMENEDGSCRHKGIRFLALGLSLAMENILEQEAQGDLIERFFDVENEK